MKNYIIYTLLIGILFVPNMGCSDLDENVLDEVLEGSGTADLVTGSIAPVYAYLRRGVWRHTTGFGLQEVASDEAILPNRGGRDWFDGGKYFEAHRHTMTPTNVLARDTWNGITINISRALTAIEVLTPLADQG
ncbi:MAG: RagB/SusD family nutrient uptake outer membrane protein, partial [Bacteroidota bacterium]